MSAPLLVDQAITWANLERPLDPELAALDEETVEASTIELLVHSILPMKKLLILLACIASARAEYALRDGDTLAFLGDSITAARGYTKIVEHYTLMRFSERKVRFVNAGQGGDTAAGCLERLERDVFSKGATVVTVAFGINDIGWGTKADEEHKKLYLDGIRSIIARCKEKEVRPIICSPAITAGDPDQGEQSYLQKMADEGMALAKSLGAETIDLQRGMRAIQRKVAESNANAKPDEKVNMHVKDGIHLDELGQTAMAYAMLKGLGAPEDVSSAAIEMKGMQVSDSKGCEIRDLKAVKDGIEFTRLDQGLPLNLGPFTHFQFRWVPLADGINRYMLTVKGLDAGTYEIRADGRLLGKVQAEALARGVNMGSMTPNGWEPGGPWDVQSCVVKELVDARDKLWMAGVLQQRHLPSMSAVGAGVTRQDEQMVLLQRDAAKPRPYRFSITRLPG
jgi:lysophospholipase L1-like esterase